MWPAEQWGKLLLNLNNPVNALSDRSLRWRGWPENHLARPWERLHYLFYISQHSRVSRDADTHQFT
jgi:hypothetical protein